MAITLRTLADGRQLQERRRTRGHILDRAGALGAGVESRALRTFPCDQTIRPLYGRVADHNAASAKVLARAGFVEVGTETAFAPGIGAEVVERIYRFDR